MKCLDGCSFRQANANESIQAERPKRAKRQEEKERDPTTSVVHMIRSRKIEQCSKKKAYTQSQRAVSTHTERDLC